MKNYLNDYLTATGKSLPESTGLLTRDSYLLRAIISAWVDTYYPNTVAIDETLINAICMTIVSNRPAKIPNPLTGIFLQYFSKKNT